MTSHLDSHMANDVKPDMLSGVQTENGIPHDRFNLRGIAHAKKTRANLYMYIGMGARDL